MQLSDEKWALIVHELLEKVIKTDEIRQNYHNSWPCILSDLNEYNKDREFLFQSIAFGIASAVRIFYLPESMASWDKEGFLDV